MTPRSREFSARIAALGVLVCAACTERDVSQSFTEPPESGRIAASSLQNQTEQAVGTMVLEPADTTFNVSSGSVAEYTINTTAEFSLGPIVFCCYDWYWRRTITWGSGCTTNTGSHIYEVVSRLSNNIEYDENYPASASFQPGSFGDYRIWSESRVLGCDGGGCSTWDEAVDDVCVTLGTLPVATVTVSPATASVFINDTNRLTATPMDQFGHVVPWKTATWSTSNANIATVTSTDSVEARIQGVALGQATISATIDAKTGTSTVTVERGPLQASISGPMQVLQNDGRTCFWLGNFSGGSGSNSYEWRRDGVLVSTHSSYSASYIYANFYLQLSVTDSSGAADSDSRYVLVTTNYDDHC